MNAVSVEFVCSSKFFIFFKFFLKTLRKQPMQLFGFCEKLKVDNHGFKVNNWRYIKEMNTQKHQTLQ